MWYNGKKKRPGCIRSPGIYLTTFYENGLRLNRVALSKKSDSAEYPSQTAYVLEQISDCSHTLAVAPFTVHPVIDGDKSHIIAGEDNVCVLSNSQVITPEAAQVFDQPAADKSLLYRVEALLYAGTIEVRPGIVVIHQNFQVGVPMFFCVSG